MNISDEIIKLMSTDGRLPNCLYHYTNQDGLLGIIQSRKIWATNILYLNDSKEFKHSTQLIKKEISSLFGSSKFNHKSFSVFLDRSKILKDYDVFVTSFSMKKDLLSQWRAYCPINDGYSIGFDYNKLRDNGFINNNALLLPCIYKQSDQDEIFKVLKKYILNELLKISETRDDKLNDRLELFSYQYTKIFLSIASVIKEGSFSEEQEWRFIYYNKKKRDDFLKINFRKGVSTLLPFVKIDITDKNNHLPLSEIVIGPNQYKNLAKESLLSLLKTENEKSKTSTSKISYRVI